MKNIVIVFLLFLVACNSEVHENTENLHTIIPTDNQTEGYLDSVVTQCSYNTGQQVISTKLYPPSKREQEEISRIVAYSGLPISFKIFSADINNAMALVVQNQRLIVFDKNLLKNTDKTSQSYWSSMSILAHEIGHHLSGHTLSNDKPPQEAELEADRFAGFLLYKLGASKDESIAALNLLASINGSKTHPSKTIRVQSTQDGWTEAARQRYNAAIPPPPEDIPEADSTITEFTKDILLDQVTLERINIDEQTYYEGVITEVSEGGDMIPVQIITDDGTKLDINYESYGSGPWSRLHWSWIQAVMVPGRRIRFQYYTEGNGGILWFFYVKALSAKR